MQKQAKRGVVRRREEDRISLVPSPIQRAFFAWSIASLEDAVAFLRVCKDWTAVAAAVELNCVICVSGDSATDARLKTLLHRFKSMTKLHLVRCDNLTMGIGQDIRALASLTHLQLVSCNELNARIWHELRALPSLRELTVQQCNSMHMEGGLRPLRSHANDGADGADDHADFEGLTSLDISANNLWTQGMVCSLLQLVPNIKRLDMSNSTLACQRREDEDDALPIFSTVKTALASLSNLTELSLGYRGITEACLDTLGQLTNLRTFRLMEVSEEIGELDVEVGVPMRGVVRVMRSNPGLTHLAFGSHDIMRGERQVDIAPDEITQETFETQLMSMSLVTLELPHCNMDADFLTLLCSMPTLEALDICHSYMRTPEPPGPPEAWLDEPLQSGYIGRLIV